MKRKYRYVCDYCGREFKTSADCFRHETDCRKLGDYINTTLRLSTSTGAVSFSDCPVVRLTVPADLSLSVQLWADNDIWFSLTSPASMEEKDRRDKLMHEASKWLSLQMDRVIDLKIKEKEREGWHGDIKHIYM